MGRALGERLRGASPSVWLARAAAAVTVAAAAAVAVAAAAAAAAAAEEEEEEAVAVGVGGEGVAAAAAAAVEVCKELVHWASGQAAQAWRAEALTTAAAPVPQTEPTEGAT